MGSKTVTYNGNKTYDSTWTQQNVFNPKTIQTSRITPLERFRLLFHKKFHSFDTAENTATLTTFKRMKGVTYVIDVKRYTDVPQREAERGKQS